MKFKYILVLILFSLSSNMTFSADFYPELGMDPFYSSFNPEYINEDETNTSGDSLVDLLKNKKQNDTQKVKKERKFFISKKDDSESDIEDELLRETENVDISSDDSVLPDDVEVEKTKKDSFIAPKKNRGANLVKELEKEEKEKLKAQQAQLEVEKEKFSFKKLWPFSKQNDERIAETQDVNKEPAIEITAEYMEYFPEKFEVEAVGDARVNFVQQGTVLSANKIIFNYDRNILTAKENVVLIAKDAITEGDFIKLDLNKPEGWLENPITTTEDIKLTAKEAFVYSDRIEEYDGVAKILKDEKLRFGSASFAGYINNTVESGAKDQDLNLSAVNGLYSIKAKTIFIEAKEDHEIVTIKNADLYFKKHKVAAIPSAKIVSNKTHTNVETNLPEFGSMSLLGAHIGPAVVLNVPGGSTLKVAPILTYSKEKFGIGCIARFRNEYNMTEAAYGTSRDEFLLRGKHKIASGLTLNYSRLTNQNEWFLGYRKPKYSASLNYRRSDYIKDLDLRFSQLYIAGVVVDDRANQDLGDMEGRFRWMTQTYKPLYSYRNEEGNIGFSTGLVAQTVATTYTSGEVAGLFRVGPAISTMVGPWKQTMLYYQTATAGETPFDFDRYRYGRSNIVLIESLKVCKYLSLGYLASIAMNREVKSDDLFQESRFLVSVGPEYAKVTIGYDAFRRNTMFLFSMLVGTKDSEIAFKRSVIKNPEKFGKKDTKTKRTKKKDYKKYLKEDIK